MPNTTDTIQDRFAARDRIRDAAPDLLAALYVALNEMHHPGACSYERGVDIVDFLGAAIAKARGE